MLYEFYLHMYWTKMKRKSMGLLGIPGKKEIRSVLLTVARITEIKLKIINKMKAMKFR